MKKLVLFAVLLTAHVSNAQTAGSNITLEASYGFNAPISPTKDFAGVEMKAADYAGFNNLQLGLNFRINDDWAVRATYMNAAFKNSEVDNLGSQFHKVAFEAVYTLTNNTVSANYISTNNGFALYAHAGLGLSINKGEYRKSDDFIGNIQAGLKPTYHFDDRWAVFVNPVYVFNLAQHTGFDGRYLTADSKATTGSFYAVNLGLSVRLGK